MKKKSIKNRKNIVLGWYRALLGPFWVTLDHFGTILVPFISGNFMVIFFWGGVILGGFNAKLSNIMQDTAKICYQNVQNCAKTSHFSPIKHFFLLKKNGQNRRFNIRKCAVCGCAWKHPVWILSVFMHLMKVRVTFEPFLDTFDLLFNPF